MKIYKNKFFKIYNLDQIDRLIKTFPNQKINLIHSYQFLVFQGPLLAKLINQYISKKKEIVYIADAFTNIGLCLSLINHNIKNISISINLDQNLKKNILSLAKIKNKNIYFSEKLKFVSL